jgi:hypothetical protein
MFGRSSRAIIFQKNGRIFAKSGLNGEVDCIFIRNLGPHLDLSLSLWKQFVEHAEFAGCAMGAASPSVEMGPFLIAGRYLAKLIRIPSRPIAL